MKTPFLFLGLPSPAQARSSSSRATSALSSSPEGLVALRAEDAAAQTHVEPDGRGLVDHHDAVPVGEVEDVLGVGVVRGPERVGPDPLQQREIPDEERGVVALAERRVVLVHAEPGEPERRAVDEELSDMVAQARVGEQVVVARGHGHVLRVRERPGEPPLGAPDTVDVESETPEPVERLAFAGGGVLGAQHGSPSTGTSNPHSDAPALPTQRRR